MTDLAPFRNTTPDLTPCNKCNQAHVRANGAPSCNAHTKKGTPCHSPRVTGSTLCRMHFGNAPHIQAAARRRLALEQIRTELDALGGTLNVDPAEALLAMMRQAAFNVAYYQSLVEPLGHHLTQETERGQIPNALVKMYDEERDRLVRYSKLCLDAGIEERLVRVAEEQGRLISRVLDGVFEGLGLSDEQRGRLPVLMQRALGELGPQTS